MSWAGRWHESLKAYGPSGRTPGYGTAKMVEGMKMMPGWHRVAFSVFPAGKGHDVGGQRVRLPRQRRRHPRPGRRRGHPLRQHWDGPYHFGAPDGVVAYVTRDKIWVREVVLPDYPYSRAPQQDFDSGALVVPEPPTSREQIQEPFVREMAIPPELIQSMGQKWRERKAYLDEMKKRDEEK